MLHGACFDLHGFRFAVVDIGCCTVPSVIWVSCRLAWILVSYSLGFTGSQ